MSKAILPEKRQAANSRGRRKQKRSKLLDLSAFQLDPQAQPRAELSQPTINEYAEALDDASVDLPPVVAFTDGETIWLADGFHRHGAYTKAGRKQIPANVRAGTLRDAILYAAGANATHGLKRSNADKQRAVRTLLADPEWGQESAHWIARACQVSHTFVNNVKAETFPRAAHVEPPPGAGEAWEDYEFHPLLCELIPSCDAATQRRLEKSISLSGLLKPITLYHGAIVDGRARYLACRKVGVEPRFEDRSDEPDPLNLVLCDNLYRKHLSIHEQQVLQKRDDELKERIAARAAAS